MVDCSHYRSNAPPTQPPGKILADGDYTGGNLAPNGKSFVYAKSNGEVWRISLPDGKKQRLAVLAMKLTMLTSGGFGVSYDGKETVYVEPRIRAKLVMIENPFK